MSPAALPELDNGIPGPIGETFGAFEPRFYGISFLLETPVVFKAWMTLSEIFPGHVGPALPLFENTCLQTALEHEIRHFHDALVSPFANSILMLRMMAAFNGMKLFNRSLQSGANCLPVPVKTWMSMNPDERAAWLASVSGDLPPGLTPPLRPLPMPHYDGSNPFADMKPGMFDAGTGNPQAELQVAANATIGAYAKATDLMRGPVALLRTNPAFQSYPEDAKRELEATFTPRNVFEASALAVQLQAAWTNIGADAANALGEHLQTSELGYAKAFRRIAAASSPPGRPTIDPSRIAAVAVWCLLGDAHTRDDFDPAVRLMRVLPILNNTGGIAATAPVAALWDDWDSKLELKSWRTNVKEMRERTARSVATYVAAAKQPDETPAAAFATVLEAYRNDQIRATDLLLTDPDAYVNTQRYVEETRSALPVPVLSVELGDNFIAPLEAFPVSDAIRIPRPFEKDGVRGWNRLVMDTHQPPRPKLLDAVLELEFMCKMCDVALSDEALRPIDSEVILKSISQVSGMVPVFVF